MGQIIKADFSHKPDTNIASLIGFGRRMKVVRPSKSWWIARIDGRTFFGTTSIELVSRAAAWARGHYRLQPQINDRQDLENLAAELDREIAPGGATTQDESDEG